MDARFILTCLGRVPPLTAIWGDSHTIVQQRCWCYDNRSHAWEDIISRLGEISLPVLMPTIVCGVHDTLHLAAGRRMHLRLEEVVIRVPGMCCTGLRGTPFPTRGTVLIRERECTFERG